MLREVPQSPFHVLPKELPLMVKKVAKLLNMLPEGGPPAFDGFVRALTVNDQLDLAGKLLNQEEAARMEERKAARVEERKAARVLFPIVQYFCN